MMNKSTPFRLDIRRPLVVAGPCSAETRAQLLATARALGRLGTVDLLRAGVWKARTQPGSFEGVGDEALDWLVEAREETQLPVAVEVARAAHVEAVLRHGIDAVWIGARTTVNPFLVQEIAEAAAGSSLVLMIKNPMHPDTALWSGAVERLLAVGIPPQSIGLIHRGFTVGQGGRYRNDPMWHVAFEMRSRYPGMTMLCDPSHIGGRRDYVAEIAQTAADLRFDGVMIESHVRPDEAWSDSAQQVTPAVLGALLTALRWRAPGSDDPDYTAALDGCRDEIDRLDTALFDLLSRRMAIADRIGELKRSGNVVILQSDRWARIVERIVSEAGRLHLSPQFLRTILDAIHTESIEHQNRVMNP